MLIVVVAALSVLGDEPAATAKWEIGPVGANQSGEEENRRAPRSNLFLAATIEAGGSRADVRIRNLSETGAMLEGPAFPPVGSELILRRQEIETVAEVVWVDASRCGVHFRQRTAVSDWIAGKRTKPAFGQARVDAIQAAVRSGGAVADAPVQKAAAEEPDTGLDARIAAEIAHVQRLFKEVSEELIRDPAVVERHARLLQNFDIGDQILGHLTRVVPATDRETAIREIGMEELRTRLLRGGRGDEKKPTTRP